VAVGQHVQPRHCDKLTEHFIPPHLVPTLLLYEQICHLKKLPHGKGFLRWAASSPFSLQQYMQEVFSLHRPPSATEIRKFWTTLINYIFPSATDGYMTLSTTEQSSSQCHHHLATHNNSYSVILKNGVEVWHKTLHSSLGDPSTDPSTQLPVDFVLTKEWLLHSLKVLLQRGDAKYLSESQESLVWHSTNSMKHVHGSTSCGGGKSMSWLLRVFALKLAKTDPGLSIVAVPYTFLAASHHEAATKLFAKSTPLGITSRTLTLRDFEDDDLPCWLTESPPNLLFVSMDAMDKLIKGHLGWLQQLVAAGLLRRIYMDEVHLLLCEPVFRTAFDQLWKMAKLAIPIITLSGTLPKQLVPVMASKLRLSTSRTNLHDITLVEGGDPVGEDITFTVHSLKEGSEVSIGVEKAKQFLSKYTTASVHIFGSSIRFVNAAANLLKTRTEYTVAVATSDVSNVDQSQIAQDWLGGRIDVLCSSTCALVGNENKKCGLIIIIGNLYNVCQLIQAANRLRPQQRGEHTEVFIVATTTSSYTLERMSQTAEDAISQLTESGDFSENPTVREQQIKSYRNSFGFIPLYSFVHLPKETDCRVRRLCRRMGFERMSNCNRCTFCSTDTQVRATGTRGAINPIKSNATKTIEEEKELSNVKQRARNVFDALESHCLVCHRPKGFTERTQTSIPKVFSNEYFEYP
jgi:hypothetical protein